MTADRIPSRCPACGAYSLAPGAEISALLAVCDVLVTAALDRLGRQIVRQPRGRHKQFGKRSFTIAHTVWPPDEVRVEKVLKNAWDVVPALMGTYGCCGTTSERVTWMLDRYVRDLAITGTPHTLDELEYRFIAQLGMPVFSPNQQEARYG